jgi:hypothetical protein
MYFRRPIRVEFENLMAWGREFRVPYSILRIRARCEAILTTIVLRSDPFCDAVGEYRIKLWDPHVYGTVRTICPAMILHPQNLAMLWFVALKADRFPIPVNVIPLSTLLLDQVRCRVPRLWVVRVL